MLESRSLVEDERLDGLENQLKEAKYIAEDAERKYDEVIGLPLPKPCQSKLPSVFSMFALICAVLEHCAIEC